MRQDKWTRTIGAALIGGLIAAAPPAIPDAHAAGETDVLVWGGNLSDSLDPHTVYDVPSAFTRLNLYDSLFEYDGTPPVAEKSLVESYTVSDDKLTWDFTLKDGVTFHDGTPLEAEDVVYSFQRVLALKRGPASTFAPILDPENVSAVDARTVRFVLEDTFAPFLSALPMVAIVNKDLLEANTENGDWGQAWIAGNDAGSGPYQVVADSFVPRDKLDMAWFPDYFRGFASADPIEQVRARPVKDDATRILAVIKGDIDTTYGYIRAEEHDRITEADGVGLSVEPAFRTFLIRIHNGRAPMNNENFRKALSYAFPYEIFNEKMLLGTVDRNPGPIPANLWGSPADLEGYTHDLDKAKAYLEKAKAEGVDVSKPITFVALVGFDQTEQAAQLLQAELRKIGVTLNIEKKLWQDASSSTSQEETSPDIWAHWGSSYLIDPDNWIGQFYMAEALGSQRGSSWYRNPEVDALIVQARTELDRDKRTALYEEISRRMVDEAVDIWIYNSKTYRAVRDRLEGYRPAAVGDGVPLREMSIAD